MNKRVKRSVEWGSKLVSLVVLFQQTTLFSQTSVRIPYQLTYWWLFASVLIGLVCLQLVLGVQQKEPSFYLSSLFPLIALLFVVIPAMIL